MTKKRGGPFQAQHPVRQRDNSNFMTATSTTRQICLLAAASLCLLLVQSAAASKGTKASQAQTTAAAQAVRDVVKLNAPLVAGGNINRSSDKRDFNAFISSDDRYVVYLADQEMHEVYELYSVPIKGGTPVKLNAPLVPGGSVAGPLASFLTQTKISLNSQYVIYIADQEVDGVYELYRVPIEGGTPVKLNPPLVSGGGVKSQKISPDNKHIIYLADQEVDDVYELYSVPIEGSTPVKLNAPLVSGGDVKTRTYLMRFDSIEFDPVISRDGTHVVYIADQETDEIDELYSVPINGGTPVKLNPPLVSGGMVSGLPSISSDDRYVVYQAVQDTEGVVELYSVPIEGGTSIKLNAPLAFRGSVLSHKISSDSRFVVYYADGRTGLYSVPVEGGTPIRLTPSLTDGGDVSAYQITPDGIHVIYTAEQDTERISELFSVPIMGGVPVKLNHALASGSFVQSSEISPDGKYIIYWTEEETGENQLYSVPTEGGTPIRLNAPTVSGNFVYSAQISPDSSRVIYHSDQLYSVPILGGTPLRLNMPLVSGGSAWSLPKMSSDGSRIIYVADQETRGVFELYSTFLATSLTVDMTVNRERANPGDPLTYSINVVPIDGPTTVKLINTLPSGVRFESSANPDVIYNPATHQVLYSGTIEPNAPLEIIYTGQVEQDVEAGSVLYGEVVVSGLGQQYAAGSGVAVVLPETVPTLNLIYANADNDLADEVRELFQKAETAAGNPSMTTLLLFDGDGVEDTYLYRLQQDTNLAESCPSLLNPTCSGRYIEGVNLWRWGEAVSTNSSLVEFLVLAMEAYPSEQVTLSLVGHGGGWSPDLFPGQPRFHSGKPNADPLGGLLWDLNPTSSFSTAQLGEALREATARTGRKIDLLYLDACLMAMSEVAYEVHDSANYLLASENWSWTSFRYNEHLSLDGNLSAEELGKQWLKHEADYLSERDYPITYSLLDLNAMDEQLAHENSLAEALKASLPEGKEKIRSAFMGSSCFDGDQDYELLPTDADDYYCDLGSFAQQLEREFGSEHPVAQAAQALQAHIDQQLVVQEIHHNGRPWEHPEFLWAWTELSGVSKYMPLGEDDWKRAYYAPTHLQSTADGRWDEFLAAYWNSATSPAPPPACEGNCEPKGPETLNEELEPMGNRTFLPVVLQ